METEIVDAEISTAMRHNGGQGSDFIDCRRTPDIGLAYLKLIGATFKEACEKNDAEKF